MPENVFLFIEYWINHLIFNKNVKINKSLLVTLNPTGRFSTSGSAAASWIQKHFLNNKFAEFSFNYKLLINNIDLYKDSHHVTEFSE